MKRQFLFCPLISPASHCHLLFHRANSALSFPINSIILLLLFLSPTHHSFTSLPFQTKRTSHFFNNGCNHFLHLSSSSSRSSYRRSCRSRILLPRRTLVPLVLLRRLLNHSEVVCSFPSIFYPSNANQTFLHLRLIPHFATSRKVADISCGREFKLCLGFENIFGRNELMPY